MSVSAEYCRHISDLLSPLGTITTRRMFGGAGVYLDGVIIGIIADDVLYFKVDDKNRADYENAGSEAFTPFPEKPPKRKDGKPMTLSYWNVPEEILEDPVDLHGWARRAWEASKRNGTTSKKKPVKTASGRRG